jgi:adenylate kinase family enzyme
VSERRIAVIGSASGNGKTTLARELARRLGVPFVELDALVHGPGWTETPDEVLRAQVAPIVAGDAWVVDGTYRGKLGTFVLDHADLVVWLDLPVRVWLPRLLRRSYRRVTTREELWNGNRETWWNAVELVRFALHQHFRRRRVYPVELRPYPVLRLRSPAEVERLLARYA